MSSVRRIADAGGRVNGVAGHEYRHLVCERRGRLLVVTVRPDPTVVGEPTAHAELARLFADIAHDERTNVAVVTGAFTSTVDAGGMLEVRSHYPAVTTVLREGLDLVHNIVNCDKPIISAVTGHARGAGLVVALLADISIVEDTAVLADVHVGRVAVTAGDHAALIWPMLCGMAKAKYYLLTSEPISGQEADRIGLVSRSVPEGTALDAALTIGEKLATGPQYALRWTKRALNHWLRGTMPILEAAIAFEALSALGPEHEEALTAALQSRAPAFPETAAW